MISPPPAATVELPELPPEAGLDAELAAAPRDPAGPAPAAIADVAAPPPSPAPAATVDLASPILSTPLPAAPRAEVTETAAARPEAPAPPAATALAPVMRAPAVATPIPPARPRFAARSFEPAGPGRAETRRETAGTPGPVRRALPRYVEDGRWYDADDFYGPRGGRWRRYRAWEDGYGW